MKYTIEFTEVIAYLSQDIEADSKEEALEEAFELMENNVIPIANSNMDYCISTERKEEPELPDGLQKYIDGVALNILYSNYHKSTNGIWSRAEIEFEHEDEQCNPYYEVNIDFGCQDDTRNEQYSQTMYFFKKGDEWTCIDDYCESCSCRGWIESNDEDGRGEIQRCDECKVFDTDEYAQKIYDQECKDYFNKENV